MNNASLTTKKARNKNETLITLEGDLSLANSSELQKELLEALKLQPVNEIIGNNITNVDISTIQLLIASRKYAETQSKELRINLELPENLTELLETTGIHINKL